MAEVLNSSGLSADYVTRVMPGKLMRSKATGVVSPAIERMVNDSEIDAPCELLSAREVEDYINGVTGGQSENTHHHKGNIEPTESLCAGVGSLFIQAYITDSAKKKITSAEQPYDLIQKVVSTKATMIAEIHHPALVDQVAMVLLADNSTE